jgi:hypothetical protein
MGVGIASSKVLEGGKRLFNADGFEEFVGKNVILTHREIGGPFVGHVVREPKAAYVQGAANDYGWLAGYRVHGYHIQNGKQFDSIRFFSDSGIGSSVAQSRLVIREATPDEADGLDAFLESSSAYAYSIRSGHNKQLQSDATS